MADRSTVTLDGRTGTDVGTAPPEQSAATIGFGLFGGVTLTRDGTPVELTQPKQRAILALLLASPGEVLAVSHLVDCLWTDPPASAVNQIHRHVGALRRLCQPGLSRRRTGRHLLAVGPGYRLAPEAADLRTFRALARQAAQRVRDGRGRDALPLLLEALRVAGTPAGDETLRHLPEFVGLEDERIAALVLAARSCETFDDHAALLPLLRRATADHRLDETLHAHHMNALCRTGRGADALAVYRTVRHRLDHELGMRPGQELEAMVTLALNGPARAYAGDALRAH